MHINSWFMSNINSKLFWSSNFLPVGGLLVGDRCLCVCMCVCMCVEGVDGHNFLANFADGFWREYVFF